MCHSSSRGGIPGPRSLLGWECLISDPMSRGAGCVWSQITSGVGAPGHGYLLRVGMSGPRSLLGWVYVTSIMYKSMLTASYGLRNGQHASYLNAFLLYLLILLSAIQWLCGSWYNEYSLRRLWKDFSPNYYIQWNEDWLDQIDSS